MGALTSKSFPFELRGWDIEKFEGLDPTDGFLSNTKVYISKNQIVQIEPDYNVYNFNSWLTDKSRSFFDSMCYKSGQYDLKLEHNYWGETFSSILKTLYIIDYCNNNYQTENDNFFTVVYDYLSFETNAILQLISAKVPFIKLKKTDNLKLNNDLEKNFQLNNAEKNNISKSTLTLLVSTNSRYEGYYLNLNLRQRSLKGNFKCLMLGSLINLTFPVSFLGSNTKLLKSIVEGNNVLCQDFKFSKNPLVIFNANIIKRNDGKSIVSMLEKLLKLKELKKTFTSSSFLSSCVGFNNSLMFKTMSALNTKDFYNYKGIFFLNTKTEGSSHLKKIVSLKMLKKISKQHKIFKKTTIFDQSYKYNNNLLLSKENLSKYTYIPCSTFYENEETFINTEGFIKRTTKLIYKKQSKSNWQILRKLSKLIKNKVSFLNFSNASLISYNSKELNSFKNYINFHYYASQTLTNLSFYLTIKTKKVLFSNKHNIFKQQTNKVYSTKIKYWLDDFFTGGRDEYSQNSSILSNCSKILRKESSTFF
uniref:NADH dehydrogenase subunit 11 n=1 Tax=Cocconeiopsis kantsiensis TaxID=3082010 RepID=UPI0030029749